MTERVTPLYDAVGHTINQIIKSATSKDNVLFAILTDGQENASHEFNSQSVKRLMKECEDDRGWTFAFIGVGADGWAATQHLSVGTRSASNVLNIDKKDLKRSYARMAACTVSYAGAAASGQMMGTVSKFWGKKEDDDDNG